MILSMKQLSLLVPDGTLDESFYKQYVALAKGSSVLDVANVGEAFRRDLVELFEANPQIVATAEEVEAAQAEAVRAKNEQDAIQRFEHWLTKGEGNRRLKRVPYNSEKIIEAIQQTGRPVTPALVDESIRKLDHILYWETWATPAPAPAQTVPLPPPKTLPNGELELPLNTPDWQLPRYSVTQIRDLDARRNPNRHEPTHGFEPMPPEISRKAVINAPVALIKTWERRFGKDAIDARLQGRG